ncbi:NAD(P)-binding oxidoreductase [Myceligenerans salitolerans]|uniref:NAD(P)H-binding protein n=1 Tax=Myceligenerans salitolerans TaxID=1230528 RepID=A0ABS3I7J1_9MICO|nr:NAD(P)-binding oxidoreductase [Myceligenerans salitolerans]MBO0608458.1 NAD(P)H-binding protein [Myceligenerans salitolerans]
MKTFIIGIAGGVGGRLARLLHDHGDEVDGLYRRPEQGVALAADGINATRGDLSSLDPTALAHMIRGSDVLVFSAGAGGEGGNAGTTAIDGDGLTTAITAARSAGVTRLVLVSVFPDAWRGRAVSDTFEHYIEVKKRAEVELVATEDLDWLIVRPAALLDDPGAGRVALAPALIHTEVTRDDVAAVLAELVHTPEIHRKILELTSGDTPVPDAVSHLLRE